MKKIFFLLISYVTVTSAQANEPQNFGDAYSLFLNQSQYNEEISPFVLTETGVRLKKGTDIQEAHRNEEINSKLSELKNSDLNKECGEFNFTEFGIHLKSPLRSP